MICCRYLTKILDDVMIGSREPTKLTMKTNEIVKDEGEYCLLCLLELFKISIFSFPIYLAVFIGVKDIDLWRDSDA